MKLRYNKDNNKMNVNTTNMKKKAYHSSYFLKKKDCKASLI